MKVRYSSNNSGGGWWLKDKDWQALEDTGWRVEWGTKYYCHSTSSFGKKPKGKSESCKDSNSCKGHRKADSLAEAKKNKLDWLGAYAKEASIEVNTPQEAMISFEKATSKKVTDDGCSCCGPPHNFSWDADGGYAGGEECAQYLYSLPEAGMSKREILEILSKGVK